MSFAECCFFTSDPDAPLLHPLLLRRPLATRGSNQLVTKGSRVEMKLEFLFHQLFVVSENPGKNMSRFLFVCRGTDDSPLEKTVLVGESVSIPCPLSTPGGSVQWLQDGTPIVLDLSATRRRQWNISPDGTAALTISEVRRTDAGRWECRELGADGSVRKVARVLDLVVGSSPSDPYLELEGRRLVHQATVTVREPQKLSLHCIVSGAIPPVRRIHWSIGEANLTSVSELFVEFSASEDAYTSRSVLALNVTRRVHGKELVCKVHHLTWLQAAAVSASLNVLYEPSFSISREPGFGLPLLEDMRVSLRCEVDANPPSDPLWVRDDGPLTVEQDSQGFLNFTPVSHHHAGWYRCTTHHEFGFFASFGYFLNVRSEYDQVSILSDLI
ncbi:uncharacterized protein TNCT_214681 [Trichonephila clavata]|uniref:Ig-like domain-containing protein n=1 Tax=Trichonephila clavata TaxID=2740835 RepID=A0A8X6H784_TRICU|nr:uncharacterized protein TNCT_214681 [Trichonephila clavata]